VNRAGVAGGSALDWSVALARGSRGLTAARRASTARSAGGSFSAADRGLDHLAHGKLPARDPRSGLDGIIDLSVVASGIAPA
jgi:hypothetical protein